MSRIQVRDGFLVLMAALWCADKSGVAPPFSAGGGCTRVRTPFRHSAVRRHAARPVPDRLRRCPAVQPAAVAVFAAPPSASPDRRPALRSPHWRTRSARTRLAGASALLGLFNLLPVPPLDGGMALRHLADGRFTRLLNGIAGVSVLVLLAGGVLLWKSGFGGWLFLAGLMVAVSFGRAISKNKGINQILDDRLRLPGL